MKPIKKIPFDSLTLAAVVCEMQPLVGGKLQRIVQPSDRDLDLAIYASGQERFLHFSCSPTFARVHLSTRFPGLKGEQPQLGAAIRKHVDGARVATIRQIGFDRQLEFVFEKAEGAFRLIAELTGRHANLILVGPDEKVLGAAHFVSSQQSVRPILPGKPYERPPFPFRKPVYLAKAEEDLKDLEGASPFLIQLLEATGGFDEIRERVEHCRFEAVAVKERGAYPVSVAALGLEELPVASLSEALERHFRTLELDSEIDALRSRLLSSLKRVLLAREVALEDLRQAEDAARRAGDLQLKGELILAYAHSIGEDATTLEAVDYEGNPISIPLQTDISPIENAQKLFEKAKRAKQRAGHVGEQLRRIQKDRLELLDASDKTEQATRLDELQDLEERARERRWLQQQRLPARSEEEKPYEGHRIRERLGPGGLRILYGENATSNDYLTLRVARPSDIWLHVRGSTSAHVVIVTGNQPDRVGPEALRFAALIAVQNSTSKHSSIVPVDYTLKKYVRKPRGAKAGTALYTHEKTLHIDTK